MNFFRNIYTKDHLKRLMSLFIPLSKTRNPRLFMTLLVRDEDDIIEENLLFHKYLGVDGFIVTDNRSKDRTTQILEKYYDLGWVKEIIHEEDHSYDQVKWVDRMIRIARDKYKAEWVINADADEFWYSTKLDLKSELRSSKFNIIECPMYCVVPLSEKRFWESDLVVANPRCGHDLSFSKFSIFYPQIPKVIHRVKGYNKIEAGNHYVNMRFPKKGKSYDIKIYHYSIRSLDHFLLKIMNGGSAIQKDSNTSNGVHWRYYYNMYLEGNLEGEYKKVVGSDKISQLLDNKIVIEDSTVKAIMKRLIREKDANS